MIYETIQDLAKKRNTSIRQIENDLHFSNGSIGRWDDAQTISLEKVKRVAMYLHVDPYTLLLVGIDMNKVGD